jgi:hypothetical protein
MQERPEKKKRTIKKYFKQQVETAFSEKGIAGTLGSPLAAVYLAPRSLYEGAHSLANLGGAAIAGVNGHPEGARRQLGKSGKHFGRAARPVVVPVIQAGAILATPFVLAGAGIVLGAEYLAQYDGGRANNARRNNRHQPARVNNHNGNVNNNNVNNQNNQDLANRIELGKQLRDALHDRNYVEMERLLNNGARPNDTWRMNEGSEHKPLHAATELGDTNAMNIFIRHGARLNDVTSLGFSPLHIAVHSNDVAAAQLLIDRHADLNVMGGWNGETPMEMADRLGNFDVGQIIMAAGGVLSINRNNNNVNNNKAVMREPLIVRVNDATSESGSIEKEQAEQKAEKVELSEDASFYDHVVNDDKLYAKFIDQISTELLDDPRIIPNGQNCLNTRTIESPQYVRRNADGTFVDPFNRENFTLAGAEPNEELKLEFKNLHEDFMRQRRNRKLEEKGPQSARIIEEEASKNSERNVI